MVRKGRPPKPLAYYPNRLREVRERLGLSPRQVAQQLGRGENWLTRLETGERELKVHDLERIAKAMGVSACQLLNSVDQVKDRQEREILEIFRVITAADRDRLIRMAKGLMPDPADDDRAHHKAVS